MAKLFIQIASLSGMLAVILGAFGAHALKARLSTDMMGVYETAVQYQFLHSLALLAVGLLAYQLVPSKLLLSSGIAFTLGIILFSGSLYLLATTEIHHIGSLPVGLITPVGGLFFISGWLLLFTSTFNQAFS